MKDVRDYFAGGKRMGFWAVAFSARATGESAWLLLGLTGMGAAIGLQALWVVIGELLGVAVSWYLMSRRFKRLTDRYDALTVPDYFAARFRDTSHVLRIVSAAALVVFVTIYVSAQIDATGTAFETFLGWNYYLGVFVGFGVVLVYIVSGGFVAVVWSDVFQGALMVGGLVALPIVGLVLVGGPGAVIDGLSAQDPAPARPGDAAPPATAAARAVPIDFAKVDRTVGKTPPLTKHARYGLFLFGANGEKRVWAILDRTADAAGARFDVLYLDRDADGDLAEPGETIRDAGAEGDGEKFVVGDFVDPATGARHTAFTITWTEASVRFRMQWRGEKVTFGGYGPSRDTYAKFASEPANAPVYVPGHDRPFEFEHWLSGELARGSSTDFKVFVGNRGDRRGAFSAVDDEFLPADEAPVATLLWTDRDGKRRETPFRLPERC
jgi:hypothetical protein